MEENLAKSTMGVIGYVFGQMCHSQNYPNNLQ